MDASDPDSVGLVARANGRRDVDGEIVLYIGGWADIVAVGGSPTEAFSGLGVYETTADALQVIADFVDGLLMLADV